MDLTPNEVKELENFKKREQQITDMFMSLDYEKLVKELDYSCCSSPDKLEIVKILCKLRQSGLCVNELQQKKLQKLISHYAIEHDNVMVLRPGKN